MDTHDNTPLPPALGNIAAALPQAISETDAVISRFFPHPSLNISIKDTPARAIAKTLLAQPSGAMGAGQTLFLMELKGVSMLAAKQNKKLSLPLQQQKGIDVGAKIINHYLQFLPGHHHQITNAQIKEYHETAALEIREQFLREARAQLPEDNKVTDAVYQKLKRALESGDHQLVQRAVNTSLFDHMKHEISKQIPKGTAATVGGALAKQSDRIADEAVKVIQEKTGVKISGASVDAIMWPEVMRRTGGKITPTPEFQSTARSQIIDQLKQDFRTAVHQSPPLKKFLQKDVGTLSFQQLITLRTDAEGITSLATGQGPLFDKTGATKGYLARIDKAFQDKLQQKITAASNTLCLIQKQAFSET
ncbi:MAG: hypothetical protein EBZ69_07010, partial [Alphaproteobacteria bacterium]|nr:hypothetical protein [Alphaproteobacteria bacterium]NDG05116.1 hypothetical protein [Alphaproteobacteria bacterium]